MNTLIGMPAPQTENAVEPSASQTFFDRWLGWVASAATIVLLLVAAVGTTLWLTRDTAVHLGVEPEYRHEAVIVSKQAPEFSSGALYLDEEGGEVTIISVTPLTTANVQYLGARSIWPSADGPYGNWQIPGRGFPRPQVKESHPITETIPASEAGYHDEYGNHRSVRLVVGFRLTTGDIGAVNGIEIAYRVKDRIVTKLFRAANLVCFELAKCQDDNLQTLSYSNTIADLGLIRD